MYNTHMPLALLLICVLALFIANFTHAQLANSPWPMFRHDLCHTGASPIHDPSMAPTFWKYYTGGAYGSCAIGPDGTIYIGVSSYLYALNSNGTLKWRCTIDSVGRSSPAIGEDGTIYVGSTTDRLYAVNPNGTVKWSYLTGGDVTSSPAIGPDGTIYVGSTDGKLYAINSDGSLKWAVACDKEIHTTSPAIGPDGTIYIGSYDKNLHAINPDGSEKWRFATGGEVLSSPAITSDGNTIYFSSWDRKLYALSKSGTLLWTFPLALKYGSTSSSPAIGPDGTIYIGSNDGTLHAISPAGTEVWRFETGSDIRSSPAVSADGTIYFGTWDGYLYAVNPNGTLKWKFLAKNSIYSSPAIASDGTVVVGALDGYIYGGLRGTPPTTNPPSNLIATVISKTQVRLQWQDNSNDEYGFRIERKTLPDGDFAFIANVGAGVTIYDDLNLDSGLTHCYRVCAYQQGGNSPYSNEACVTMPGVAAPADLKAVGVSESQIDLTWKDRSSTELGFEIERMTSPNGHFKRIAVVGPNTTSYSDVGLTRAETYYYRVRSFDAMEYSTYSNEAWAQTHGMQFSDVTLGNTSRKQMALTFDAGVTPIRTGLLDILRQYKVYSTLFITGKVAEAEPWNVIQAAIDGHYIANHTYTHPDLTSCSDEEIIYELTKTDDVLYTICGHHARPYFRAPGLKRDQRVLAVAQSVGYRDIACTAGGGDFGGWTVEEIINNTLYNAKNGCIMLYHCSPENTEIAMPTIITELRNRGYELVTVPEILAPEVVTCPDSLINPGWNLISIPIEPANPNPLVVFRNVDIDGKLYRWDNESTSFIPYDLWDVETFGIISPDEGYWFYTDMPVTIKCAGTQPSADRYIKLAQKSSAPIQWNIIGYPFSIAQEISNCRVHNPNASDPKIRVFVEAVASGWLSGTFWWWDSASGSLRTVGLSDEWPDTTQLEPWRGYWVQTFTNGLDLIIPKP
ncbi:MAG: PQQ-binding-like beta-propeller repeat protein [Armatimonadota bacterium]|nr:PQQ-binding-like beta-propeller repeat protein [Armatimonadota bacterium]